MGVISTKRSQIANDTDEVLEVKVEHNGNSSVHLVPAHNCVSVTTASHAFPNYFHGCVMVKLHVPSAVAAGQWHWIKRIIVSGSSVLIRKGEKGYAIYQTERGEIWKIDEGDIINNCLGY